MRALRESQSRAANRVEKIGQTREVTESRGEVAERKKGGRKEGREGDKYRMTKEYRNTGE